MTPKLIVKMVAALVLVGPTSWWSQAVKASNFSLQTETISWRSSKQIPLSFKEQTWRHDGAVSSVAFSPNNRQMRIGSDNYAVLRDSETGKVLQSWRHYARVTSAVFSPNGKEVLAASGREAVLREVETGRVIATWLHSSDVNSVAFSPNGKQVLTGSYDKSAVLRDTFTEQTLQTLLHDEAVFSVAFSPDGKKVLTGSGKGATVWDVEQGRLLTTFKQSSEIDVSRAQSVTSVAFSPDGRSLLIGSVEKTVVLRDLASGNIVSTWRHDNEVTFVAFSPNGNQVLTASGKDAVLREIESGQALRTWNHDGIVFGVTFSPNGNQILTGSISAYKTGVLRSIKIQTHFPDVLADSLKSAEVNHRSPPGSLADRQRKLNVSVPVKTEFESTAQYTARVQQWNLAAQALNADFAVHYKKLGPLPLKARAKAFEEAVSQAYGNPELLDIRYEPETARFFATLTASGDQGFKRTISIPVPNDQARAVKELLESSKNGLEVELRVTNRNELIWGQPRFKLGGRVYVAQYTDKDFVPSATTQIAAAPALQAIAPPPMVTMVPGPEPVISVDPGLAKLQVEVLQKEREQAEASARRVEEARLRERLAELNRLTKEDFKDDLPALLAKLPALKPNPRVHVVAIGINDYADVPDVPFADRSAQQFAEIARRLFGAQKQNIVVLTNSQATSGALRGRLRTMLNRLNPQDQLLFYYAGHGVPGKDGTSAYLLAQDGGPGSYEEPDLKLEQLYAEVAKSRVGTAKLFIDACFSGRSGKDTIVFEGIAPIVVAPKQSFPDSQRLAVLTAGRGDQFSNQDKERGHRLFSYHLMRVLVEDGQRIAVSELHSRLRTRVLDDSRRIGPEFEQDPELFGNARLQILTSGAQR